MAPSKKKLRTKYDKADQQKPASAAAAVEQGQEQGAFAMLDLDLQSHILGFLVHIPKRYLGWLECRDMTKNVRSVSNVSTSWRTLTGDLVNQPSAPDTIITPRDLAELKSRIASLDLLPITDKFVEDLKDRWGEVTVYNEVDDEPTPALDLIINFLYSGGSYEQFAKQVASEYTKFLLVKCVETLVAQKEELLPAHGGNTARSASSVELVFLEKCVPSKVIDVFWHAHMLSPKKYYADCNFLIGQIVDHDASYVSANLHEGSDYKSKKKCLFKFEHEVLGTGFGGSLLLDTKDFNVENLAESLLSEMYADMYEDNDCG